MANSPSLPERLKESDDDVFELIEDLETMIEDVENISVLLSCMSYDMVALRANPEVGASMRLLEEAYRRCRASVCGSGQHKTEKDKCS